nr:uncharacterized protein LOC126534872 [Dermacentor andersoni]
MPLQLAPTLTSYTLPPVALDIQMAVEKHRSGMHFEKRQRLIQWLFHDLCSYGMHSGKLYEEASKALVAKYPGLADSTGTGYVAEVWDGEDESSIRSHITSMKKELLKPKANFSYVTDYLMETAAICLLPCLVKERKEAFLTTDRSTAHRVLTVICSVDAWDSTPSTVSLDDIAIEENTLSEALSTLFTLYWAFDIVLAKGVHKTLAVIAKLLDVPSNAHMSPLARVAYTVLKACFS